MAEKICLDIRHYVVLKKLGRGGWFIRQEYQDAALAALRAYWGVSRERNELEGKLHQHQKDYEQLPGWKQRVEFVEREAREANQARRGLERRNTQLETELAETQTKLDDFQRAVDLERKHLEAQMAELRKEVALLKEELEAVKRDQDRYLEKLSAVALNAKQIQVIVENGLTDLVQEKAVVEVERRAEQAIEEAYAQVRGRDSLYSTMMEAIKSEKA